MYLVTQFKVKRDSSGNITKYKANLRGRHQETPSGARHLQPSGGVFIEAHAGTVAGSAERSDE